MKYVDVVIDNKSDKTDRMFTYACQDDGVCPGQKVIVPFAKGNRDKEAYVFRVLDVPDKGIKNIKSVKEICKDVSLTEEMIKTCTWMRKRYLCRYIDAVKSFVPAGAPIKRGKVKDIHRGSEGEPQIIPQLTREQEEALSQIYSSMEDERNDIFLLHGVTGSGKTEVYMRTIARALKQGKTAVMLVPEISLTKQIIDRFIGRFGAESIAVLHSKLTKAERYDQWQKLRSGSVKVAIGARSAVFAPLSDIGVFVIDEEHEATYKSDSAPKYETVEVAVMRAKAFSGIVVAGSATPSVVSRYRASEDIYRLLTLKHRYNKLAMPKVSVVDMRKELREGNRCALSRKLYDEIKENLDRKKQIILFLNRRGYSTFISCRHCGYVVKCPHCEVSLTYHKSHDLAVCHYCGYKESISDQCPQCGSKDIRHFGAGTEKIEDLVEGMFSDKTVGRLDMDSVKKRGKLEKILRDFGKGKIDILTGTQLVAKGLDFKNVGLVGIVSADVSLNIPDFRSAERTFQLITQAAGRAGRGDEVGSVVIQTYTPDHYAVQAAARGDYNSFYEYEKKLRKLMDYQPYGDIIQIIIFGKEEVECKKAAALWKRELLKIGSGLSGVMGPESLLNSGAKEMYRESLIIKCPQGNRNACMRWIEDMKFSELTRNNSKGYHVTVDVNPFNLWRS